MLKSVAQVASVAFTHDNLLKLITTETSGVHLLRLDKTRQNKVRLYAIQALSIVKRGRLIGIKCFIHFEMKEGERCFAMEKERFVTIQKLRPNGHASKGYKSTQTI